MKELTGLDSESNFMLPELSFLENRRECFTDDVLTRVFWHGDRSGATLYHLKRSLACCAGTAEVLLIFNNGSMMGLRVGNLRCTEHLVDMILGKHTGRKPKKNGKVIQMAPESTE